MGKLTPYLMWIVFYFLIVLSTVVYVPINLNDSYWIPKEWAFTVLGFGTIAFSLFFDKNKRISFSNFWLGLLLLYAVVSFGIYFYKPLIFNNPDGKIYWQVWNFRPTLNVILGIWLIQVLVENTDSFRRWVTVAKVLCWIGFGLSIYSILQWLGMDQLFGNDAFIYHYTDEWANRS